VIQAIEIAPEQRDEVRINCGGDGFVDWAGNVWAADRNLNGGGTITAEGEVSQASPTLYDRGLYLSGRTGGRIEYILLARPGLYSVHLKFAEMWFEEAGKRPMRISVNGVVMKSGWDPATAAEMIRMAMDLRFDGISPVEGRIAVVVEAEGDAPAILQGLEIE
jgi:hypothetical protein